MGRWVGEAQGGCLQGFHRDPLCLESLPPRHPGLALTAGEKVGTTSVWLQPVCLSPHHFENRKWPVRETVLPPLLPARGAIRMTAAQLVPPLPGLAGSSEQIWPVLGEFQHPLPRVPCLTSWTVLRDTEQTSFLKNQSVISMPTTKKDELLFCNNRMHFFRPLKPVSLTVKGGPEDLSQLPETEFSCLSDSLRCPLSSLRGPQGEEPAGMRMAARLVSA